MWNGGAMFRNALRITCAAGLLLLSASISQAQVIAYDAPSQPGNQAWPGNLGLDFDVNAGHSIIVTSLGAFDNLGNGFTGGTVNVAIFNRVTGLQVGPSQTFTGTSTGTAGTL